MSYIGLYFCNCKAGFDTPQERTMHMGTCVTMQRAEVLPDNLRFKAEDFTFPVGVPYFDAHEIVAKQLNQLLAERLIPVIEVLKTYATIGARLDEIDIQRIDVNCLCDEGAAALELLNKLERK